MDQTDDEARGLDSPEDARWSAVLEALEDLGDWTNNIYMHTDATINSVRYRGDYDIEPWVAPALAWLRRDIAELDRRIDATMQILDGGR